MRAAHTYASGGSLFEGFPFCEQALAEGLFAGRQGLADIDSRAILGIVGV